MTTQTQTADLDGGRRFRCVADQVLVRLDSLGPTQTAAGVWTPGRTRRVVEAAWATVLAGGPGHYPPVRLHPSRPTEPVDLSPVAHSGFEPVDPAIVPGARVLLESAQATDYADPACLDIRVTRAANVIAVEL